MHGFEKFMHVFKRLDACFGGLGGLYAQGLSSGRTQVRPPKVVSAAEPAYGCMDWPPNLAPESCVSDLEQTFGRRR